MDISDRRYVEHPDPKDPSRMDRWYLCPCCGYPTLGAPWNYEFCHLCDWFDDGVNDLYRGMTLAEGRENFARYRSMKPPGGPGPELNDARVVGLRERLIKLYDAYMIESDPARRTEIWREVRQISDSI